MSEPASDFQILATDYDGTLTDNGHVAPAVLDGLRRFKASGRRLVLVTGRELGELLDLLPEIGIFDRVVAENGGVLFKPDTEDVVALADPPDVRFVDRLRHQRITPLRVGRVIVATRTPHDREVSLAIRELGLSLDIAYNKGAVMVLPAGVNKASGLRHALDDLDVSPLRAIGVGDAENDEPFLGVCGCSVAVANAVDSFKSRADLITTAPAGEGVLELIETLLGRS